MKFLSTVSLIFSVFLFARCYGNSETQDSTQQADTTPVQANQQSQSLLKEYIPKMELIKVPVTFNSNNFDNMSPKTKNNPDYLSFQMAIS